MVRLNVVFNDHFSAHPWLNWIDEDQDDDDDNDEGDDVDEDDVEDEGDDEDEGGLQKARRPLAET